MLHTCSLCFDERKANIGKMQNGGQTLLACCLTQLTCWRLLKKYMVVVTNCKVSCTYVMVVHGGPLCWLRPRIVTANALPQAQLMCVAGNANAKAQDLQAAATLAATAIALPAAQLQKDPWAGNFFSSQQQQG